MPKYTITPADLDQVVETYPASMQSECHYAVWQKGGWVFSALEPNQVGFDIFARDVFRDVTINSKTFSDLGLKKDDHAALKEYVAGAFAGKDPSSGYHQRNPSFYKDALQMVFSERLSCRFGTNNTTDISLNAEGQAEITVRFEGLTLAFNEADFELPGRATVHFHQTDKGYELKQIETDDLFVKQLLLNDTSAYTPVLTAIQFLATFESELAECFENKQGEEAGTDRWKDLGNKFDAMSIKISQLSNNEDLLDLTTVLSGRLKRLSDAMASLKAYEFDQDSGYVKAFVAANNAIEPDDGSGRKRAESHIINGAIYASVGLERQAAVNSPPLLTKLKLVTPRLADKNLGLSERLESLATYQTIQSAWDTAMPPVLDGQPKPAFHDYVVGQLEACKGAAQVLKQEVAHKLLTEGKSSLIEHGYTSVDSVDKLILGCALNSALTSVVTARLPSASKEVIQAAAAQYGDLDCFASVLESLSSTAESDKALNWSLDAFKTLGQAENTVLFDGEVTTELLRKLNNLKAGDCPEALEQRANDIYGALEFKITAEKANKAFDTALSAPGEIDLMKYSSLRTVAQTLMLELGQNQPLVKTKTPRYQTIAASVEKSLVDATNRAQAAVREKTEQVRKSVLSDREVLTSVVRDVEQLARAADDAGVNEMLADMQNSLAVFEFVKGELPDSAMLSYAADFLHRGTPESKDAFEMCLKQTFTTNAPKNPKVLSAQWRKLVNLLGNVKQDGEAHVKTLVKPNRAACLEVLAPFVKNFIKAYEVVDACISLQSEEVAKATKKAGGETFSVSMVEKKPISITTDLQTILMKVAYGAPPAFALAAEHALRTKIDVKYLRYRNWQAEVEALQQRGDLDATLAETLKTLNPALAAQIKDIGQDSVIESMLKLRSQLVQPNGDVFERVKQLANAACLLVDSPEEQAQYLAELTEKIEDFDARVQAIEGSTLSFAAKRLAIEDCEVIADHFAKALEASAKTYKSAPLDAECRNILNSAESLRNRVSVAHRRIRPSIPKKGDGFLTRAWKGIRRAVSNLWNIRAIPRLKGRRENELKARCKTMLAQPPLPQAKASISSELFNDGFFELHVGSASINADPVDFVPVAVATKAAKPVVFNVDPAAVATKVAKPITFSDAFKKIDNASMYIIATADVATLESEADWSAYGLDKIVSPDDAAVLLRVIAFYKNSLTEQLGSPYLKSQAEQKITICEKLEGYYEQFIAAPESPKLADPVSAKKTAVVEQPFVVAGISEANAALLTMSRVDGLIRRAINNFPEKTAQKLFEQYKLNDDNANQIPHLQAAVTQLKQGYLDVKGEVLVDDFTDSRKSLSLEQEETAGKMIQVFELFETHFRSLQSAAADYDEGYGSIMLPADSRSSSAKILGKMSPLLQSFAQPAQAKKESDDVSVDSGNAGTLTTEDLSADAPVNDKGSLVAENEIPEDARAHMDNLAQHLSADKLGVALAALSPKKSGRDSESAESIYAGRGSPVQFKVSEDNSPASAAPVSRNLGI